MSSHSGRTAIVTGASSGIGRASAETLARAGFIVFGTSRRPASNGPDGVTMLTCDVTEDASVNALVSSVLSKTGRIDVLINNAGVGLLGGAEESSIAQVQALFDVNLFGVMRVTNAVLPSMRERRQGRIINISSVLGLIPAPYSAHYAATKIRSFGIRVALIEPAYTRSVFDQNSLEPDAKLKEYDQARANTHALIEAVMLTADLPEIVAEVVLQAASAQHLRRRYTAGKVARQISILRRFAPVQMFDKSMRKQMRLPV
ncbi:MAG: oxidoreductase [Alphaproteobacteria bacterium]|nr:MAG: oxidoreductase [Alphaproteobacteria bacterium]